MADNVGNADARPDLDLDEEFGDERPTIDEQEMAEAEAGCGETGIGIPLADGAKDELRVRPTEAERFGRPSPPTQMPAGHPQVPAGATMPAGHPVGVPRTGDRSEENIRRAVIIGSVMASFNIEDFSLDRMKTLKYKEIVERFEQVRKSAEFAALV